jgi:hypothetical protein
MAIAQIREYINSQNFVYIKYTSDNGQCWYNESITVTNVIQQINEILNHEG